MIEDEDGPNRAVRPVAQPPLGTWSVTELQDYIGLLRAEIARAEAAISAKTSHRTAAESVFRA